MIPPLHFGGPKGKSAEDAILCATHDIQAAHNHGLAMSSLTFDISGFFNNVSHPVLITKLREFRVPLPMVKWTASFVSDRQTAMCLDGKRGKLQPMETGLPQGSPTSPILTSIYTASLTHKLQEGMAQASQEPEIAQSIHRDKATLVNLIIYVDDGKISVASKRIKTNSKRLTTAYQIIQTWMAEHGLNINPDKRELIHHTWRNRDYRTTNSERPAVDTPVIIPARDAHPEERITAARTMKWLGVTFDNKLTFMHHLKVVTTEATKAVNSLSMVGNSVRGLHQLYRRQIIQGAILPMVMYASPAWWNGTKQQANIIEKLQNRALRWITRAFHTTPIGAMQIEASLPPISLVLDYTLDRKANAATHLNPRHPISQRLPLPHRSNDIRPTDGVLFQDPHRPIGANTRPENRATREQRNAKCTSIYKIGQQMVTNTERINRHAEPPWHRVDSRVTVRVPPPSPGKSPKKQWAKRHKSQLKRIEARQGELLIYTDGSLHHENGVCLTGAGVVGYNKGAALFQCRMALGSGTEVYDAEMEGLARGAEKTREWIHERGPDHGVARIWFFADNTGALQRIYKGTPGYNQECSRRFRQAIHSILDLHPKIKVNLEWVPGHHNIAGNDTADTLAKRGSVDRPTRPEYTTAAYTGNACRHALQQRWRDNWRAEANRRHRSDFSIANNIPPSITPTERFRKLDRKGFSRVLQCRTGHAHIGSYYDYFEIPEPRLCNCGSFETRNHILMVCDTHNEHRHILRDNKGNLDLIKTLATPKGILRLATFIKETRTFDKLPEQHPYPTPMP